eukprot:TRINITY_DN10597_c0_g1_i1.p1 TRINITY_DN10597_c0_g1~~TRINITY_DN10597_c0_g1_i1.p1  ORF type:complete len:238 (-),score=43.76 TRINITY_DN10597_c0_g1_i1:191-904(-)
MRFRSPLLKIFFFFLVLSTFAFPQLVSGDSVLKCGKVFDGISKGRDIGRQKASYPITANWEGFTHPDKPDSEAQYQYAIISQDVLTQTVLDTSYYAPESKRCRDNDGLEGQDPDVIGWTTLTFKGKTRTKDTFGALREDDLDLKNGYRYYTILRVQLGEEVLYTNTDGVYITDRDNYDDDDDDDDLPGWAIGLIVAASALCALVILLLILIAIAKTVRGEQDKYAVTVHRNENLDKV